MNDNDEASQDGSVSGWIHGLKSGEPGSAEAILDRYFSQVVSLAKQKMGTTQGIRDEEDIALSVFVKFFDAATKGNLAYVKDRDGLWRLLFAMTKRKLIDNYRYEHRKKRHDENAKAIHLDGVESELTMKDATPEMAAMMADDLHALLMLLNERQKQVVLAKLGGATNEEVAEDLGCSVRTVERILQAIRQLPFWRAE